MNIIGTAFSIDLILQNALVKANRGETDWTFVFANAVGKIGDCRQFVRLPRCAFAYETLIKQMSARF